MTAWPALAVLCLSLAACAGSSDSGQWRREGAGAAQFAADRRDCRQTAWTDAAPTDRDASLAACLRAKGWSDWPPGLARSEPGLASGPGFRLAVPPDWRPTARHAPDLGRLSYAGPGGEALEIVLERRDDLDAWADRLGLAAAPTPPAAPPPLVPYDRGTALAAGRPLAWTSALTRAGGPAPAWLGGITILADAAAGTRLVLSAVAPLPAALAPPRPGLKLDAAQATALERWTQQWLTRLAEALAAGRAP